MNSVLTGGVEFGTGASAKIDRPGGTAGKTGTSEGFGDAWFVGYTPELSTSVWMGYADSRKAMENIKGTAKVFGGTLPAATWKDYMTKALAGVPKSAFPLPPRAARPAPAVGQHPVARARCRRSTPCDPNAPCPPPLPRDHGPPPTPSRPTYRPSPGQPLTPDTTCPPYVPLQLSPTTPRRSTRRDSTHQRAPR